VVFHGLEELEKYPEGLLFLCLHMASGDLLGTVISHRLKPISVITKRFKSSVMDEFWFSLRRKSKMQFIDAHGKTNAFDILKAFEIDIDDSEIQKALDLYDNFDNPLNHTGKGTRTENANYNIQSTDYIIYVDTSGGNVSVFLPTSPVNEQTFIIKISKMGNNLTLDGNGKDENGRIKSLKESVKADFKESDRDYANLYDDSTMYYKESKNRLPFEADGLIDKISEIFRGGTESKSK
jgi:hypothetical protein